MTSDPDEHADRGVPDRNWDLDCRIGDPVGAMFPGRVESVSTDSGYGLHVRVLTPWGAVIQLSHLDQALVVVGDEVDEGTLVGLCGNSGAVIPMGDGDGSHLDVHYEVDGVAVELPHPDDWWLVSQHVVGDAGAVIEVLAPLAGAVLRVGELSTVAWNTVGSDARVRVDVWKDGLPCELGLAASEPASGSIPFAPPPLLGRCSPGPGFVIGVSNGSSSDFSGQFTIVGPEEGAASLPAATCTASLTWVPPSDATGDTELWIDGIAWYPDAVDRGSARQPLGAIVDRCSGPLVVNAGYERAGGRWWACADPYHPTLSGEFALDGVEVSPRFVVLDQDRSGGPSTGDTVDCTIE